MALAGLRIRRRADYLSSDWLWAATATSLLAIMATCWPLWTQDKEFPTVPVLPFALPLALEQVLLTLGIVGVAAPVFLTCHRSVKWVGVGALALLALGDVNRLQPWNYQAILMLGFLALADPEDGTQACRLLLAFTYLWSGLHKFNFAFQHDVYGYLLDPVLSRLGDGEREAMLRLWFVPAVVEAVLGLALLFGRSQKWAAIGLVGMHVVLLLLLGPLGRDANSSVWPWNIGNALLLVLLFVAWPAPKLRLGRTPASWIAALALGAAPALNLLDLWPAYLSANLYSGNIYQGFVLLSEERAVTAPDGLGKELRPYEGKLSANLSTWSRRVQNVPAFPEAWALRRMAYALCRPDDPPEAIEMVLMKRPGLRGPLRRPVRFECCRRD